MRRIAAIGSTALVLLALARSDGVSFGAEIAVVDRDTPAGHQQFVAVEGDIELGDWRRFVRFLRTVPAVHGVLLRSDGGSLDDGLAIAKHIYVNELDTMVTGSCHSVCAVMFLAGRQKYLAPGALLTVHSAYKAMGDWVVEDEVANGTVAWFIGHMGYPLPLARLWVITRSDGVAPITLEMNDAWGLGFTILK